MALVYSITQTTNKCLVWIFVTMVCCISINYNVISTGGLKNDSWTISQIQFRKRVLNGGNRKTLDWLGEEKARDLKLSFN